MKINARRWILLGTLLSLAAAALAELRKPRAERTWHGELLGFVPYDLRPPTWSRVRASLWNPDDRRILTPRPFGVGWGLNLYRLQQRLRSPRSAAR
jgi:hypothetical protein